MSTVPRTIEHTSRRLLVPLPMPYDRAVKAYEKLVPLVDAARFAQLANWDAVLELADINAPLGFMIYWRADVTATMAGSRSGWKSTEYLMGNHTIAERMYRHDPSVMLHAPLRTVIYADADGDTYFAVDQPSALFSSYDNPAIAEVGLHLDSLVAGLLTELGAPVPAELRH
ncbi:DUF302 domain-containing protein [Actinacidiphila oryziradicis]|jgi:hypothetical protein|uniref:DUF302 domain-containing protein n=1 Tax=Actinacidiphila oryziradicis TaxID=2571141 RepID=A0A4V5MXK3_9ACTN|nr:DUF302 domain-containing protein [Actinacidiphila oryziradicis]TKA00629.1 DUF302 domain-containing protein [Actinacidiphila oryziradicis]